MNIIISLPSGRLLNLEYQPNEQIKNIKAKAASETGISVEQLSIICEGRKLDEAGTLESNNLKDNSKITVMSIPTA